MNHRNSSALAYNVRELQHRPGTMDTLEVEAPAPKDFGTALIGSPEGAPMELQLRLESVHDGILVSGTVIVSVHGECSRCLDPIDYELPVDVQELFVFEPSPQGDENVEDEQVYEVRDEEITFNIIDTPGHADFGGEVERGLEMVDGVILLVDSSEGPLPQTRFVLRKALAANLPVILVVNKVDRPDSRLDEVVAESTDLLLSLASDLADEHPDIDLDAVLDVPVIYASAKARRADTEQPADGQLPANEDLEPLFRTIIERIPGPSYDEDAPLQAHVTNLDASPFLGRLALLRIHNGTLRKGQTVAWARHDGTIQNARVSELLVTEGLERKPAEEAHAGDIVAVVGIKEAFTGDTLFKQSIGRSDLLDMRAGVEHWKAQGLDFSRVFYRPEVPPHVPARQVEAQAHGLEGALDLRLIEKCRPAIERGEKVHFLQDIRNVNRSVGAMLSGELIRQRPEGLPDHTVFIQMEGNGGQSFGAFLAPGITLYVIGDANDYTGKGLSGGRIAVRPSIEFRGRAAENIIVGNTALYGATSGEAYFRGVAGERFAVRLSGASAVVEGTGDHGCEYMTGGTAVIIGPTGRNFGAGMSGGTAYVLDLDPVDVNKAARESGELTLSGLDEEDEEVVTALLEKHWAETGSPAARALLDDVPASLARFTRVLPRDFAAVRSIRERAEENGADPDGDAVWQEILEVTARG